MYHIYINISKMDKEQIQQWLEDIDTLTDAITRTCEYLEWCLVEILKQKEQLNNELNKLNKKRNPVWFNTKQ
jgi:hypothetical protein